MKIASALSVALVVGLSVAMWTSHASAQLPAGYGAAAAKCRAQMRAQYPTAQDPRVPGANGHVHSKSCLFGLGYRY